MARLERLFDIAAHNDPDRTAVICGGDELSYRELESRANRLARYLREQGVQPGEPIGICTERSLEMMVGLLGVMKAGAAYVPLDPAYPVDRIAFMLEDSQARFVLTQGALRDILPAHQATVVCLDDDWPGIAAHSDAAPDYTGEDEDLAYVIYTSGSTGRPKGVKIPHRALTNLLLSVQREPGLGADDRLLAVTTLSFDIAGLELYLPLVSGACTVIASRTVAGDGVALARLIDEQRISVMQATPASWRLLLDSGWRGNPALRVLCGGETLTRELAERLLPLCRELWNLYGPTETTIWSTVHKVASGSGPVSIGLPVANTDVRVLDEQGAAVAPGQPGELYIGGAGVAHGYLNRDELTAERFISMQADGAEPRRVYRTGDLVRQDADGRLDHLGRVDFQVKVRGFRIELGEIEATLDSQPSVAQSVVMAREDVPGEKRLVAYLVAATGGSPSSRELRKLLAQTLPDYMVPGLYVTLAAFPLTPNGKVDRKALPAPDMDRPELSEEYVAPGTDDETRLAAIWAAVLRVGRVGINDNFFELGGDSLKVAQVATRLRHDFGVDVPLRAMFESPTVAGLLPVIETARAQGSPMKDLPFSEVRRGESIPLSFSQERVWFLHQFNPDNLAYNFQSTIEFLGTLDVAALERTLDEVLRRHESYRTTFPTVDAKPVQIVHPATPFSLPMVDLSNRPEEQRETAAKAWCDREFQHRFDLARLPLVRWTLMRFSAERHVLVHMEHHLVHDGWSFNVFIRELVDIYTAFHADEPSPLPELEVQFAEFATWQHQWMRGDVADYQLRYWREKFRTIPPVLQLPTKGPRPATQSFRGASLRPEIDIGLCNDLRALSRTAGSTLFMTMLAAFVALLHRYTGESDVAVGTFFANRRLRESEGLIGMILNNTVIRAAVAENPRSIDLIHQIRDLVLEAANYQDVPFDRVVDAVQPKRDFSFNPLFQIMFSFHDEPMPEQGLPELSTRLTPVISNGSAKFDLGVIGIPHSAQVLGLPQGSERDGLTMIWEHNTDLFETPTIERMIEHYKSVLRGMVADPQQRLSELPLSSAEEQRWLSGWNSTGRDYATDACLHRLFEAQAAETPDATAVVCESRSLSYLELDRASNHLARHLLAGGVRRGTLVGVCVERSERMLVALLAIMKTGGAYVPVDPTFPLQRRAFMLTDAAIRVVVTEADLCAQLPMEGITQVRLDEDAAAIAALPAEAPEGVAADADDLAYVIFTSGSTGLPKGVRIPHRALVNFVNTMRERPGMTAADRLFAVTTLSFDIAGLELYLPLCTGACVIIGSRAIATNGEALAAALAETGATVMQATPSTWQMLVDSGWSGNPALTALCGGEALPRALAETLLGRAGSLWNMYGPTETTIWSAVCRVESGEGTVPIGTPIGNTSIFVLDGYDKLSPPGVIGEICIGGLGLAQGYLNRDELDAQKFISNPLPGHTGKLYRTGDLGRLRADGSLECLGRTDHQIKLRGFRIELGEIESLLDQASTVRQSVVVARERGPGDVRLVAYVVPATGARPAPSELLSALSEKLPDYMVPSSCVVLDEMPLTPNGKVDRSALPEPKGERVADASTMVAPRNETERKLQAIWQEVLGVSPLGVTDDFFAVGGHSLLAVRLVAAMQSRTGERVSLAQLLQGRTIESIARSLGDVAIGSAESGFLALQSRGNRLPFFAGGSHPKYLEVAKALGSDQPFFRMDVYALQSARIAAGRPPLRRIEDLASHYIDEIRKVQPRGPYHLGGGCEGGYLAFEMALQLQRMGESVATLVIWIPPPLRDTDGFTLKRWPPFLVARQLRYLVTGGALRNSSWQALKVLFKHEQIEYLILSALANYSPSGSYQGRLTIVRTEHSPVTTTADLNAPWRARSTGGADVHVIAGSHDTWFEHHLGDFAAVLRDCLEAGTSAEVAA